jgi:hypothetical protein
MKDATDWPSTCPFCRARHDAVTLASGGKQDVPVEGDVTLCFTCGQFCVFDATGGLRVPTPGELVVINADPRVRKARESWEAIKDDIPSRRQ